MPKHTGQSLSRFSRMSTSNFSYSNCIELQNRHPQRANRLPLCRGCLGLGRETAQGLPVPEPEDGDVRRYRGEGASSNNSLECSFNFLKRFLLDFVFNPSNTISFKYGNCIEQTFTFGNVRLLTDRKECGQIGQFFAQVEVTSP